MANTYHHNWITGQVCFCDFDHTKFGRQVKVAGKLHDFLMSPKSRPDLQTPEGQQFLQGLSQHLWSDKTDPLMPWLTREWKKGRFSYRPENPRNEFAYEERDPMDPENPALSRGSILRSGDIEHWADWYHSNSPNRRGQDIMQMKVHDMPEKIHEWEQWQAEQLKEKELEQQAKGGEVVHHFPDDWTIRRLRPEDLEYEGWAMRGAPTHYQPEGTPICVGDSHYQQAVRNGQTAIYSLRDPEHKPHVTMEMEPQPESGRVPFRFDLEQALTNDTVGKAFPDWLKDRLRAIHPEMQERGVGEVRNYPDPSAYRVYATLANDAASKGHGEYVPQVENGRIEQIQGRGNSVPKPEYQQRMKDWFQTFPEKTRPNWQYPTITDVREIPGHDEYETPEDGYDTGGYEPHGDYGLAEPSDYHWPDVLDSLLNNQYSYAYRGAHDYKPDEGRLVYQKARELGQIPEFAKAVEGFGEKQQSDYHDYEDMNIDHLPQYPGEDYEDDPEMWNGEAVNQGWTEEEGPDAFQQAREYYDESRAELEEGHPGMKATNNLYQQINPHWNGIEYVNEPRDQEYLGKVIRFSKIASNSAPTYYRWAFSPASGEVDLGHNWEGHPATIGYHGQMAANRNEPGLVHGYAYRIDGGWRLTDWDHRPVEDPFVVSQVVQSLREREGIRQAPPQDGWQETAGLDWDRQHYALPQ